MHSTLKTVLQSRLTVLLVYLHKSDTLRSLKHCVRLHDSEDCRVIFIQEKADATQHSVFIVKRTFNVYFQNL